MFKEEKSEIEMSKELIELNSIEIIKNMFIDYDKNFEYYGDFPTLNLERKKAIETVLNLIENQKAEIKKKDKIINEYEKECRQFKAFCKRVRRDEKHDVDLFNQGQEQKCNQFLNLISGEPHWSYEGKYFDDTDNQIE